MIAPAALAACTVGIPGNGISVRLPKLRIGLREAFG